MTLARMLVRLEADDKDFQKTLDRSIRGLSAFTEAAHAIGRGLTIGVTLPLGLAAKGIFDATLKIDSLRVGLEAMTGSSREAAIQLERLKEVAKSPGIGFAEAIQGSLQLQAVGFSARDAERSLRAFANAVAAGGGSREQLERVIYQFTQMSAAGKVLGQDLRPIIQQSPLVARALSNLFGTVNAAEIAKRTGSFQQFFDLLMPELERMPTVSSSARTAVDNLSDSFERLQAAIGDKLLPALTPMIEGLTSTFDEMEDMEAATVRSGVAWAATAAAAGPLITVLGSLASAVALLKIAFQVGLKWFGIGGLVVTALAFLTQKWIEHKLTVDDASESYSRLTGKLSMLNREQLQSVETMKLAQLAELDRSLGVHRVREAELMGTDSLSDAKQAALLKIRTITPLEAIRSKLAAEVEEVRRLLRELGDAPPNIESRFEVEGPTQIEELTDKANLLVKALEVIPMTTEAWGTAQSEAIKLMSQATALAEGQSDAIGEAAVGYRSIVSSLKEALRLGEGTEFGRLDPMNRPGTKGAPKRGELEFVETQVEAFVVRARLSAEALHEHRMATDAAYAAQWKITDQMRRFGFELQTTIQEMGQQFKNPAQTGRRALQMMSGAALEVAQNFTPLGLVAYFISQILEELAPAIEAFLSPVAILAKAVMPLFLTIMEALFPVIKMVTIALTYLGQIMFSVTGAIGNAVGKLVYAVGWAIDKIPGIGDFGLMKIGKEIEKIADGYQKAASDLGKAREEIRNLEWGEALETATEGLNKLSDAVMGAVQGFRVAQIRHQASAPAGPYAPVPAGEDRTARPRPQPTVVQGASFSATIVLPQDNGRETYRQFYDELDGKTRSRGPNDLARQFWESLPEPS